MNPAAVQVTVEGDGDHCMRYFAVPDELPACEQPPAAQTATPSLGG
jgi:hypothetical protein